HATLADNEDEPLVWFLATAKEGNVTVPMSLMFQVTERAAGSDAFELPTADARLFVLEAERSEAFARFVSEGFLHQKTVRTKGDDRVVLGIALEFLEATDLFSFLTAHWGDTLLADDGSPTLEFEQASLRLAKELGEKIAEMHAALVDDHAGPFQRETFTSEDG